MKKMLGTVLCLVVIVAGAVFAEGQQEGDQTISIGVTVPSADHGWTGACVAFANQKADEVFAEYGDKFDITIVTADNPSAQVQVVENLMLKDIDYLVILPHESAPLTPIVREAHDNGIKCVVVDRGLSDDDFGYVNLTVDNVMYGALAGEWIAAEMKKIGGGNLLCLGGAPCLIDKQRMDAFFAEVDYPSIVNVLGKDKYEFADWQPQKGLELTETFLVKFPHIDAVYCQSDDVLVGVIEAYKEAGRDETTIFFGGCADKKTLKKINDGDPLVRATVTYPPQVIMDGMQYAIDVALGVHSSDFHNADKALQVQTPCTLITRDNIAEWYDPNSPY